MTLRPARMGVLVVALGLAVAGCSSAQPAAATRVAASPSPSPSPSASRTPVQLLEGSIPVDTSPIYHFSIRSTDFSQTGVIDPPDRIAEIAAPPRHFRHPTYTETTTVLLNSTKSWIKVIDTPHYRTDVPAKWMALDPKKLTALAHPPSAYYRDSDPGPANEVFGGADDVTAQGGGRYSGVTDVSNDGLLTAAHRTALGSKATHLPFTAVLDSHGRLVSITMKVPAAGKFAANTYTVTYDHYGTVAAPALPTAAEQVAAPAVVYSWYK